MICDCHCQTWINRYIREWRVKGLSWLQRVRDGDLLLLLLSVNCQLLLPYFPPPVFLLSSTMYYIHFLPSRGRRRKMTHKLDIVKHEQKQPTSKWFWMTSLIHLRLIDTSTLQVKQMHFRLKGVCLVSFILYCFCGYPIMLKCMAYSDTVFRAQCYKTFFFFSRSTETEICSFY